MVYRSVIKTKQCRYIFFYILFKNFLYIFLQCLSIYFFIFILCLLLWTLSGHVWFWQSLLPEEHSICLTYETVIYLMVTKLKTISGLVESIFAGRPSMLIWFYKLNVFDCMFHRQTLCVPWMCLFFVLLEKIVCA